MRVRGLLFGCLLLAAPATVAAAEGTLYWSDTADQVIRRAELNGSGVEDLVAGVVSALDLDRVHSRMYWLAAGMDQQVFVRRAHLDGSNVEELFQLGTANSLAVDPDAGKLYVGTTGVKGTGSLWRSNLNGSGLVEIVDNVTPLALAVESGGLVYYTDFDGIYRVGADGSGLTRLVQIDDTIPSGIDLDDIAGKIYWAQGADTPTSVLRRSNLDGSGVETLLQDDYIQFVALDLVHGKVYWTQPFVANNIRRANLDGSGAETVLSGPRPWDIAVAPLLSVPASSTWGLVVMVALILAGTILVGGRLFRRAS